MNCLKKNLLEIVRRGIFGNIFLIHMSLPSVTSTRNQHRTMNFKSDQLSDEVSDELPYKYCSKRGSDIFSCAMHMSNCVSAKRHFDEKLPPNNCKSNCLINCLLKNVSEVQLPSGTSTKCLHRRIVKASIHIKIYEYRGKKMSYRHNKGQSLSSFCSIFLFLQNFI